MSAPKIINGDQLQAYLWQAGYETGTWSCADRLYVSPTRDFLTGPFSAALYSFLDFFKILVWVEDAHDCDDFARVAAGFAQILHVLTPDHPPATALAFGEFWYVRDHNQGAHAINLALVGEEVFAYEPQTRRIIELSDAEKKSGLHTRF